MKSEIWPSPFSQQNLQDSTVSTSRVLFSHKPPCLTYSTRFLSIRTLSLPLSVSHRSVLSFAKASMTSAENRLPIFFFCPLLLVRFTFLCFYRAALDAYVALFALFNLLDCTTSSKISPLPPSLSLFSLFLSTFLCLPFFLTQTPVC